MMKSKLMSLLLVAVTVVTESLGSNVCYVEQGGCKYRVTVLPTTSCVNHANDDPDVVAKGSDSQKQKVDGSGLQGAVVDDPTVSLQKLDNLETKLVKMMEELSIRSLRHIREIRADLRQMTQSVNALQGRTTRNGGGAAGGLGGGGGGSAGGRSLAPNQCPSEFVGVGTWRSCYRFSNFEANWHDAREYCSALGANLVSLDSIKEAYIIDYLIKSNAEYHEPKGWWTSGSYIVRSQRWMWTEQHQLRPISFSRWAPGEPNARSTMHCMVLYKPDKYQWHDATCTDKHTFICEID